MFINPIGVIYAHQLLKLIQRAIFKLVLNYCAHFYATVAAVLLVSLTGAAVEEFSAGAVVVIVTGVAVVVTEEEVEFGAIVVLLVELLW